MSATRRTTTTRWPVVQSQHLIHMSPRKVARQTIRHHSLIVEPAPAMRYDGIDAFGNPVVILDIEVPHKELVLHARSSIETMRAGADRSRASTCRGTGSTQSLAVPGNGLDLDVIQYRCASRLTTPSLDIADYAAQSFTPGRPVLEAAIDLNRRIYRRFHVRRDGDRHLDADRCRCSSSGAASARTSRIWRSRACGRCACRRAMSAGTF